jgi:DNA replication licensing factor MCM3
MQASEADAIRVSFCGSLGGHLVTPRGLTCRLVNKFVGVQGIVTSISRVKPKLLKSAHYCETTTKHSQHEYPDKYTLQERDVYKYSFFI